MNEGEAVEECRYQVGDQLEYLENMVEVYAKLASMLENKLSPVLRPISNIKANDEDTPERVPLAIRINEIADNIQSTNGDVQDIIDRMEL